MNEETVTGTHPGRPRTWLSDGDTLKLLTVAVVGAISVFIWWRLWAFTLTHLGYSVLTSHWFVSFSDMKRDPVYASNLFFSLFDLIYACVGGLLVCFGLGYFLRVKWLVPWLVFLAAVVVSVRELASAAPEVDSFMLRFPISYAFALASIVGFFVGGRLGTKRLQVAS